MRLVKAAAIVRDGVDETLLLQLSRRALALHAHQQCPGAIMGEIRRRTRVVGAFPDGQSALMLVAARLRHSPAHVGAQSAICR